MVENYIKNCPNCNKEIKFFNMYNLERSLKNNSLCMSCRNTGNRNPFYGKRHTKNVEQKVIKNLRNDVRKGTTHSEETKRKMSEKQRKGINHPFYGKHRIVSEETRKKLRIAAIEWAKKNNIKFPNFNPKACELIEEYGKQHGYNFQHALNGGEYYIKELGYYVDGYDKNKNIVIEIDEKYHNEIKQKQKDLKRQHEIENLLGCVFIRLTI